MYLFISLPSASPHSHIQLVFMDQKLVGGQPACTSLWYSITLIIVWFEVCPA